MATTCRDVEGLQVLSIVAADGAGSARRGGEGAAIACEVAQRAIAEWAAATHELPTPNVVADWCSRVCDALQAQALTEEAQLRDYACTLLIAVVTANGAAYAHIGDGGIVIDNAAGLELVFWPESGEYANMTRFITDTDALERVRIRCAHLPPEEVAVFTDGIQRLALNYASASVHAPFFAPMLAVLRRTAAEDCEQLDAQLNAFLDSEKVNRRTDDDKTLVLATRRVEPVES